jgi:hypothetical protein
LLGTKPRAVAMAHWRSGKIASEMDELPAPPSHARPSDRQKLLLEEHAQVLKSVSRAAWVAAVAACIAALSALSAAWVAYQSYEIW